MHNYDHIIIEFVTYDLQNITSIFSQLEQTCHIIWKQQKPLKYKSLLILYVLFYQNMKSIYIVVTFSYFYHILSVTL